MIGINRKGLQIIKTHFYCNASEHAQMVSCADHVTAWLCDNEKQTLSPQSHDSWLTLLKAAKIRKFTPVLVVAKDLKEYEVPPVFYHRKCRGLFTVKRDLETMKRKTQEPDNEDYKPISSNKRNVASSSRVCGKEKYISSTSSREPLVKATQLRVDKTL